MQITMNVGNQAKFAISNEQIAGMVVLYNSEITVFYTIQTYLDQIQKLYVVDNSDRPDPNLIRQINSLSTVVYISNNGNQGIANALNVGARQAIADGFAYLLTMDDDTKAPFNLVCTMVSFLQTYPDADRVGILSAVHSDKSPNMAPQLVLTTMTSGNLLNLTVYANIGPFREEFFIDHVDHEYGLRLNQAQYEVIELPNLQLIHQLGQRKQVGLGKYTYVSHNPIRGYYIIRNGLVLIHEYGNRFPEFKSRIKTLIGKEIIKALFFEGQKILRLQLLWRGFIDNRKGRSGKLLNLS